MSLHTRVLREIVAWGRTDGVGWIFVFKTTLAALLAMSISMRLELGQPVTAMITVFIIMQPQTGMVLTKSLYRVFGTLAGTLAGLVLLGLFAQERVLFLGGLALWSGLCTMIAARHRNFRSYAFTLAGYTSAMVCIPMIMQPTGFFDYAVNRATEVVIGIICAGTISEVIFPYSLGESINRTLEARYNQFIVFARKLLTEGMPREDIDRMHLQFAGTATALESLRSSLSMEAAEMRMRDFRLRCLNRDFMALSTTLHSLCHLLIRLKHANAPAIRSLTSLNTSLAKILAPEDETLNGTERARQTALRLAKFRPSFARKAYLIRQHHGEWRDRESGLDTETALELQQRFVEEIEGYMRTYASLMDASTSEPPALATFTTRTDPLLAFLAGGRTMILIGLVATFWIASAWPYGASAVMMATIVTALFAPAPDPALAIKTGLLGALNGFFAALVCKFFILPSMDGIMLLALTLAPFLMVGSCLTLQPKLATVGLGYIVMFCFMVAPSNDMLYDPIYFINFGGALILGVASAALIFAVVAPLTADWLKRRIARMLRNQVVMACSSNLSDLIAKFESGTRDLMQRTAARPTPQDPQEQEVLGWFSVVLEIGRAVIHLRQEEASAALPQPVTSDIRDALQHIARFFRRPDTRHHKAALQSVEHAMEVLLLASARQAPLGNSENALRRMLTELHLIRSSLLDGEAIFAATVALPKKNMKRGPSYAT